MSRYKSKNVSLGTKRCVIIEKKWHSLIEHVYTEYENIKCYKLKSRVKSKKKRKKIYKNNGLDLEKHIKKSILHSSKL
jgi:hypothetical protein